MKLNKYTLTFLLGCSTLFSCSDKLEMLNPDRKSTRLNSSNIQKTRMPASA